MSQDARGVEQSGGRGHAVVIGAGLAGLTAARALANSMDHVTVIERDHLPRGAARRRGLPQARHTHSLTTTAQQGLEELFPGIGADFARAGAVRIRLPQDALVLGPAGWLPRFDADLSMLSASRDLIDAVLRARLRAEPAVTFLAGHEVQGLQGGPNDTVTGVWTRRRERPGPGGAGPHRLIPADFVVDASGHASRAPHWLAGLGYEPPRETVVPARTTYASTVFAPPLGHVADWQSLLLTAAPGHPRQGALNVIEGGRLALTLTFADGTPPPTDHAALLHAAGLLRHPLLRDVIESATPLGPVHTCTRTENRWRHYDQLRRWPDQFLVMGDALAVTDPAHGQGMTLAVQSALVLDGMLSGHGTTVGLAYRLRRALAHRLSPAWQSSTRHLRTTGPAPAVAPHSAGAGTTAAPDAASAPAAAGTPAAVPGTAGTASTAGTAGAPSTADAPDTAAAAAPAGQLDPAASGAAGVTGAAGLAGVAGTAGTPGPGGAAGAAGSAGSAGTADVPDTAGAAAPAGQLDPAAASGAAGVTGAAGAAAPPGAADVAGTLDPAPAFGAAGMPGAAGAAVPTGAADAPDTVGAAGTTAAPGSAGARSPAATPGRTASPGVTATAGAAVTPRPAATTPSPATATPHPPAAPATNPARSRGPRAWFAGGSRTADPGRPPRGLRAWLARRVTARIAAEAVTEPYAAARLLARVQAVGTLAVVPGPRARRVPVPPPVPAPPSITHGEHARRRRAPAPAVPVIGVATGSARLHPAGSSAQWPAPAPAGERRHP